MSYLNFNNRLQAARDRIWSELETAHTQDPERELSELEDSHDREIHDLNIKRLFAGMGLLAVAKSMQSIQHSLKRQKADVGTDQSLSNFYARVIDFAENASDNEIKIFQEAHKAYLNATNK